MSETHSAGSDGSASSDGSAGLGHEVKLLVDMVVERSAPWLERVRTADHPEHGPTQPCVGWCPICTAVNVARGQGPEFTARAFEQAAQAVALLRAVLADRWHPEGGVHMPGFEPDSASSPGFRTHANAGFGTSDFPNATLGKHQSDQPQKRATSPRVQHFAVRKAEPGEQQR